MWKSVATTLGTVCKNEALLLSENVLHQQLRTTYILRRKFPVPLHKKNKPPKTLRSRHYVYDLVKNLAVEKQRDIDVILTSYVEGVGNKGDRVSVKSNYAYQHLLLPGLAVYVSPENLEEYKDILTVKSDEEHHSSPTAVLTVKTLSRVLLSVVMNKDHPWTLKPVHIKTSFRKCGYIVPEHTITMPEKEIKGPNLDLENKEFYVTVTINKTEKVPVRCRIHHWSTEIKERIPYLREFWMEKSDPIFEEDSEILNSIPHKCETTKQKTL